MITTKRKEDENKIRATTKLLFISACVILSGCHLNQDDASVTDTSTEYILVETAEKPSASGDTGLNSEAAPTENITEATVPAFSEPATSTEPSTIKEEMTEETSESFTAGYVDISPSVFFPDPSSADIPVLKKLAADYLAADGATLDENPLIWEDIDILAEQNPELAQVFVEILSLWDRSNPNGFVDELPQDNSLCFIVLGYQLNSDGTMQPELINRLQTALEYAKQYPESMIMVTGGNPKNGISEAKAMTTWLIANGLESSRILVEDAARNTIDNVIYTHKILKHYTTIKHIAVITSGYHLQAATQLFLEQCFIGASGLSVVASIPSPSEPLPAFSAVTRASWMIDLVKRRKESLL